MFVVCQLQVKQRTLSVQSSIQKISFTGGYATMVHGRGCSPHRCKTTFANLEITSLWRHRWRHNSETMKSSELSNGGNRIALRRLRKTLH